MLRRLRALRVVHPFPSILNSALVALIALVAGADPPRALLLAGGMLGMQLCIGATNDVVDRSLDARAKPWRPIPAGLVSSTAASVVAATSAAIGLALALFAGPVPALLWVGMVICGLAYNFGLKPTPWAWVCFSVAFALLPIYAWYGAAGVVPPRVEFVVALAVLAGPALQLANGLVDLEVDSAAGLRTLAASLGRARALIAMGVLIAVIHLVAWATLGPETDVIAGVTLALATAGAVVGLWLSAGSVVARQYGWSIQAVSVALLGWIWLGAVGRPG